MVTVTKTSGSLDDADLAVPVDGPEDILRDCAGGCGQKVLFFGFPPPGEWSDQVEGALCLTCRAKPLAHTPEY